jgi:hypothetical protein
VRRCRPDRRVYHVERRAARAGNCRASRLRGADGRAPLRFWPIVPPRGRLYCRLVSGQSGGHAERRTVEQEERHAGPRVLDQDSSGAVARSQACDLAPQIGVLQASAEDIYKVIIPLDRVPDGADGKVVGLARHRSDVPALHGSTRLDLPGAGDHRNGTTPAG